MKFLDTSHLRGDVFGGLTAGIVALPLALAFGEASGAGPIAGLWGAIFVGFFASLFGGTPTNVSGPTGPMVVVFAGVFASLTDTGNVALVFGAVVLAGILQIVFGVLKLGQYIKLVPYPVISGFMSGIGCIIIALQFARLFGHEPEGGGTIPALKAIPSAVADPNFAALFVGLVTLAVVFFWPSKWGKWLPGALAALVIGTILSLIFKGAPILGAIPTGLPEFNLPEFSRTTIGVVFEAAFILAVLGAIDSLLTSLVADNMTRTRHDSEKELIGQGIGNTVAGFFGAIPGAGATMRTVVNIRSGGVTKIAGMLHAVVLLLIVLSLSPLASQIPHAVLAGILVKVGYDIIDVAYLKRAHKGPRWDLVLMAVVLGLTVFVDLIQAVAVGVVLAALGFIKRLADTQLAEVVDADSTTTSDEENALLDSVRNKVTLFDFTGPLSFGAAADLGHQVREKVREHTSAIVLDFTRLTFIDVSAARAVETIAIDASQAGKTIYVAGLNEEVAGVLEGLGSDESIPVENRFEQRLDAIKAAVTEVKGQTSNPAGATSTAPQGT